MVGNGESNPARVQCRPGVVGTGAIDPIVMHNHSTMGHEHLFFGNTALLDLPTPTPPTTWTS